MWTVTGLLAGLVTSFLVYLLGLALASIVVPGIRSGTPGAFLLAAATYALLALPAAYIPRLPIPFAGLVTGLLVSTAILWILGEIVPDFEVRGLGSALAGALVVLATGMALASLAVRVFPLARGLFLRLLTTAVEVAGGG